ncbi:MAG: hypothetical protein CFE24_03690 [Flavobacterium sp. BFFFF2]|nr:MAG: hypothetical protein CFE24_03690 [Flavobacterium sp. BFFFF2]
MKSFLFKISGFLLAFFLFDKLFILLTFIAPSKEVDQRLEQVVQGNIHAQTIILGSSRAARDISAKTIQEQTKTATYSLAYPGSNVAFQEFILRSLIASHSAPKTVLLVLDNPIQLANDPLLTFRLDRLYPLVKYPIILDELVAQGEKNKWMAACFYLHRIGKSSFDLRQKHFSAMDTILADGSLPVSFQKEDVNWKKVEQPVYDRAKEDSVRVRAFEKIIDICNLKKIRLVCVIPPIYQGNADQVFFNRMKEIIKGRAELYHFDEEDKSYSDFHYFYDETHLKNNGAIYFSKQLGQYLTTKSN